MSLFKTTYTLEESIIINASKKNIWEQLIDAEKGKKWSPWIIIEPNCEHTVRGKLGNVGYREYWNGKYIGEGEGIVKDIQKEKYVKYELNFIKPFKSFGNISEFVLEQIGRGEYKVIWKMTGVLPFFLFFMKKSMTAFIKADFKRGLIMLKDLLEIGKLETSTDYVGTEILEKKYYLAKKGSGSLDEMSVSMGKNFKDLHLYCNENNLEIHGGFSVYNNSDMIKDYFEYEACLEISENQYTKLVGEKLEDDFYVGVYESAKVAKITHGGDYKYLSNSWTGAFMFLKPEKLSYNKKGSPIELYEFGPHNTQESKDFKTHILIPIK